MEESLCEELILCLMEPDYLLNDHTSFLGLINQKSSMPYCFHAAQLKISAVAGSFTDFWGTRWTLESLWAWYLQVPAVLWTLAVTGFRSWEPSDGVIPHPFPSCDILLGSCQTNNGLLYPFIFSQPFLFSSVQCHILCSSHIIAAHRIASYLSQIYHMVFDYA